MIFILLRCYTQTQRKLREVSTKLEIHGIKKIRKSSKSIIFNELYFYKRLNHVIVTLKLIISFFAISLQLLQ